MKYSELHNSTAIGIYSNEIIIDVHKSFLSECYSFVFFRITSVKMLGITYISKNRKSFKSFSI